MNINNARRGNHTVSQYLSISITHGSLLQKTCQSYCRAQGKHNTNLLVVTNELQQHAKCVLKDDSGDVRVSGLLSMSCVAHRLAHYRASDLYTVYLIYLLSLCCMFKMCASFHIPEKLISLVIASIDFHSIPLAAVVAHFLPAIQPVSQKEFKLFTRLSHTEESHSSFCCIFKETNTNIRCFFSVQPAI